MQYRTEQGSRALAVLRLLRPEQWVKNVFVFGALIFAGKLLDPRSLAEVFKAFVAFCFLSSAGYAINDVLDAEADRQHPMKRLRPIASGALVKSQGVLVFAVCFLLGAVLSMWVNWALLALGIIFVALHLLYTYRLKRYMLVDVMCIALGFVLRAIAGGVAIKVPISPWLITCTFTLALFLGFGKRRCEVAQFGNSEQAAAHRITLSSYSLPLLDQLLSVSGGVAIVTYILYTVDPLTVEKIGARYLLLFSVPIVIYCVFRVSLLVEAGKVSGPTEAVTRDRPVILALALWAVYAGIAATWGRQIEAFLLGSGRALMER
jgi:4-hydroxybenzoate polyprenyltransferase